MDVRCERCHTEYELDENRATPGGVAVKCTSCGHVFKVHRPGAEPQALPLQPREKPKEWKIKRANGQQITLRGLPDLQRAIVERRVAPEDEVSLSGESWRRLGSLPELASFFELVQAANAAKAPQPQSVPLPAPAPAPPPFAERSMTMSWEGPESMGTLPTAQSQPVAEPAWTTAPQPAVSNSIQIAGPPAPRAVPELGDELGKDLDGELTRRDLQQIKRGGSGIWIALLLFLLVGAGAAWFYWQGLVSPFKSAAVVVAPPPPVAVAPPLAPQAIAPKPSVPVPAVPTPAPAPEPPVHAAPAVVPAPHPAAPPAKVVAPPKLAVAGKPAVKSAVPAGKDFNYYLEQGHKLLDSRPEQALALFDRAGELQPDSPEPDSGRGLAYSNLERWPEAISAFQQSLKKSPEFTEAIMGLAEAYRSHGNRAKAIVLYQRYLDLTPDGPDAPVAKAQLENLRSESSPPGNASPASPPQ